MAAKTNIFAGGTVLVVDDDNLMREVVSMMVEENGGLVLTAEDGEVALELFKQHTDQIDYLFIDFSMPNMNGYEAVREILAIKPTLYIVLASGLNSTPEVTELSRAGAITFLNKPFREEHLVQSFNSLKTNRIEAAS